MTEQKLTVTITKMISITNSSHILNVALKLSQSQSSTDNQPVGASISTTAIGTINKYIVDIQTNVMMGDIPSLEFWLNSCPKAHSQLSVWAE